MKDSADERYRILHETILDALSGLSFQNTATNEALSPLQSAATFQSYEHESQDAWNRLSANAVNTRLER